MDILSPITTAIANKKNREFEEQKFEYQQEQDKLAQDRADSAISRGVQDAYNAGISPMANIAGAETAQGGTSVGSAGQTSSDFKVDPIGTITSLIGTVQTAQMNQATIQNMNINNALKWADLNEKERHNKWQENYNEKYPYSNPMNNIIDAVIPIIKDWTKGKKDNVKDFDIEGFINGLVGNNPAAPSTSTEQPKPQNYKDYNEYLNKNGYRNVPSKKETAKTDKKTKKNQKENEKKAKKAEKKMYSRDFWTLKKKKNENNGSW